VGLAVFSRALAVATLVVSSAGGPTVDAGAFAHHGRLAFVSRNSLWLLDGDRSVPRRVTTTRGRHPLEPLFSPDGKWLAFTLSHTAPALAAGGAAGYSQVWLARGDGSAAHPVPGLDHASLIGWSPKTDRLAVAAGPVSKRVPFEALTTVRLVMPGGSSHILLRSRDVLSAAWSPDGRELAVVNEDPQLADTLAAYPVSGGKPTVWAAYRPQDRLNGMSGPLLSVAGWWRGLGIGVWVVGDGATRNLDATPLDVISKPGAKPKFLLDTLSMQTTRVVAGGTRAVAFVADVSHGVGGGRIVWDAKQVTVCIPRGSCTQIVTDRRKVTIDPAWSPDGRRLAFVEAPDRRTGGWGQRALTRWYGEHVLRVYDTRTHRLRTVPSARGATAPLWSADGKSIVYVADDGVWLLPSLGAKPTRIASPLFTPSNWPSYFGQIAWPLQLAWWSRR
jgi:hypothetical protein